MDLRWGVNEEQKAEGKVLPICLEEIKRCRPYFIGLLGERYGWVPDEIPKDLIDREPWLKDHLDHSVTELEILHGVLNNPEMADHAFFYFRDPSYLQSLPEEESSDFTAESAEHTEKLTELKRRIKNSRFPVEENYPDPKTLGESVRRDLEAAALGEDELRLAMVEDATYSDPAVSENNVLDFDEWTRRNPSANAAHYFTRLMPGGIPATPGEKLHLYARHLRRRISAV